MFHLHVLATSSKNSTICGEKDHIFCWWAVDIIAASQNFTLYYNGKSEMIENNIRGLCDAEQGSRYGISYVDIVIVSDGESLEVLAEVSYYCCKFCATYKEYSYERIVEDLLDHYYERRLEPLLDTDRYCFNMDGEKVKNIVDNAPCIFVINANSMMKVYSGPMFWNQIDITIPYSRADFNTIIRLLRDGKACNSGLADTTSNRNEQCLKLASEEAYFILCCCWIDPFQCTYEPREKLLVEKNKMIWQELAKTRDPEIVLITESIISGSRDTKWSYYDFIYSFPQKSNGTDIIVNDRRYYCAQLLSFTNLENQILTSATWTKLRIEELPLRYRFCKFSYTALFQSNMVKSIQYKIEPDFERTCKNTKCSHTSPKCLTDVLRAKTMLIRSSCCCRSNLCNTWADHHQPKNLNAKSGYFAMHLFDSCFHQSTTYLRANFFGITECVRNFDFRFREEIFLDESQLIVYKFQEKSIIPISDRRNLTCTTYHTFPLIDPYCYLKENFESQRIIFQYYSCKCEIKKRTIKLEQCDAGITSELLLASKKQNPSTCFFTSITGHHPLFASVQEINLRKDPEEETEEAPICAAALLISNFGLFYRFYKVRYFQFRGEILVKKRFSMIKEKNHTTYIKLCRSNETYPCNNLIDLIGHQLNYSIRLHSKTKKPQSYHQCVVSEKAKARVENCSSTSGCFLFTYLNSREKLTGCVDKIPALVKVYPNLSPLLWCLQKTHHEKKYRCRAYKGTTDFTTSGTLCCCNKDCFIMTDEDEYGFNPFERVLIN